MVARATVKSVMVPRSAKLSLMTTLHGRNLNEYGKSVEFIVRVHKVKVVDLFAHNAYPYTEISLEQFGQLHGC